MGAWGWVHGDGSVGTEVWGQEHGGGSMGIGVIFFLVCFHTIFFRIRMSVEMGAWGMGHRDGSSGTGAIISVNVCFQTIFFEFIGACGLEHEDSVGTGVLVELFFVDQFIVDQFKKQDSMITIFC